MHVKRNTWSVVRYHDISPAYWIGVQPVDGRYATPILEKNICKSGILINTTPKLSMQISYHMLLLWYLREHN